VQYTRNPVSLIRALEKLDADAAAIRHVSRSTAPLWLEFPRQVLGPMPSRAAQRLARELLLDERIDNLRELAVNLRVRSRDDADAPRPDEESRHDEHHTPHDLAS